MAAAWPSVVLVAVAVLFVGKAVPAPAPAPATVAAAHARAPAPAPTSDGTSIDQGIAYLLMLVALVLTYLIHPLDVHFPFKFF